MSTSSEAVMVSPEQCATAPKSALTKGLAPAPAPTSSARVVLLAVLALAAATGAMFGVVVFGNEFTKDVHPKGDTYGNSVTLVDTNDRAIATADVESFVALLDLPLLGTAELNKVDGITFSTYKGIEHHKITGYTVTKESAAVGDSVVETPRLSLRSEPGVTIEVSVRDAKAWILEVDAAGSSTTDIDASPQRRLADGAGSCLANGACLYSRDELLLVDAETRKLSEGGFFARADVAAYQVDLNGQDVLQHLSQDSQVSYLDGRYLDEGGNEMVLRAQRSSTDAAVYLKNLTDGSAKLMTMNGTFLFDNGGLSRCTPTESRLLGNLDLDALRSDASITYSKISLTHGREVRDGFIPHADLTGADCGDFSASRTNFSSPKVREEFFQQKGGGNSHRKMLEEYQKKVTSKTIRKQMHEQEMMSYMMDPHNERSQIVAARHQHVRRRHLEAQKQLPQEERELGGADDDFYGNYKKSATNGSGVMTFEDEWNLYESYSEDFTYTPYAMTFARTAVNGGVTYITHFDLWLATRLADPTFINDGNEIMNDEQWAVDTMQCSPLGGCSAVMNPETILNLAGTSGISRIFKWWAGLMPAGQMFVPWGIVDSINFYTDHNNFLSVYEDDTNYNWQPVALEDEAAYETAVESSGFTPLTASSLATGMSKVLFHAMFPGSCSGGYSAEWVLDLAGMVELGQAAVEENSFYSSYIGTDFGFPVEFIYDWCELYKASDDFEDMLFDTSGELTAVATILAMLCDQAIASFIPDEAGNTDYMAPLSFDVPMEDSDVTADVIVSFPNSWASYLQKDIDGPDGDAYDPEYVVAFQGTKATDLSMLQYNTRQSPIFTYIGGDTPMVIPEGYYDYMAGLLACIDDMITSTNSVPSFITGHSLGGAAATLYARSNVVPWAVPSPTSHAEADVMVYPRLVTFGAAPTFYIGSGPGAGKLDTKIKCVMQPGAVAGDMDDWCGFGGVSMAEIMMRRKLKGEQDERRLGYYYSADDDEFRIDEDYWLGAGYDLDDLYMLPEAWEAFQSELGEGSSSSYCTLNYPQSVRFYHKFDPIPSIALWKGNYAHSVNWAVMVYDKYATSCSTAHGGCPVSAVDDSSYTVDDLGMDGADPSIVDEYLCTMFSTQAATWVTGCEDSYSSYMSMMNPFPCGQILFHEHLINFLNGDYYGFDTEEWMEGDDLSMMSITKEVFGADADNGDIVLWTAAGTPEKFNIFELQYILFHEFETFAKCASDWFATVDSYLIPSIIDMWVQMGFLFTFTYVHSTYGFYPLCTGEFVTPPSLTAKGAFIEGSGPVRVMPNTEFHSFHKDSALEAKEFSKSCSKSSSVSSFCRRPIYKEDKACKMRGLDACDYLILCDPDYENELSEMGYSDIFTAECQRAMPSPLYGSGAPSMKGGKGGAPPMPAGKR